MRAPLARPCPNAAVGLGAHVNARWQAEMAELFEGDGAPDAGFRYLPEVFNLDDQLARAESSDQD